MNILFKISESRFNKMTVARGKTGKGGIGGIGKQVKKKPAKVVKKIDESKTIKLAQKDKAAFAYF